MSRSCNTLHYCNLVAIVNNSLYSKIMSFVSNFTRQTRRNTATSERMAMKRLLGRVRSKLRISAIMAGAAALCGTLAFIAIAEIARELIVHGTQREGYLWLLAIGAVVAAIARLVLMGISMQISHYADSDFQYDMRTRLTRHLALLPLGELANRSSGEIKKTLADDVDEMHHLVAHAFNESTASVVAALSAFAYLVFIDWRMALVALIGFTISVVALARSMKGYPEKIAAYTKATAQLNKVAVEHFDGVEATKIFPQGGLAKRLQRAIARHGEIEQEWIGDFAKYSAISKLFSLPVITLVILLAIGGWFMAADSLSFATLLPFLIVGTGMVNPLFSFVQSSSSLRKARMAAAHTVALLEVSPLPEPKKPKKPSTFDITFSDVSFSYNDTPVLTNISFAAEQGTVTAIVGASGSGKTTLTRLIPRFYDVVSGSIAIGGVDIRDITTQDLLGSMDLLFQQPVLLRDSAYENIRLGKPNITVSQVKDAARKAAIHDVIMRLPQEYQTILTAEDGMLSGGEQQRLTLARTFLRQAPILILDEPTSALDIENEELVQQALAQLQKGKTTLVVAHRLHTIQHADQILVLDEGKIVEHGTHRVLMEQNGLYSRLWQLQEKGQSSTTRGASV